MIIAVDVGGTKTLVAGFKDAKRPLSHHRFPTPKEPSLFLAQLVDVLKKNYDFTTVTSIVIAVPGVVKHNTATFCPNLGWRNFHIAKELHEKLPYKGKIFLENDANLAGLAETHALTPRPDTSLYVTVSTGIGTGIISDGYIDQGFRLSEGGHMLLEYDGIIRHWESFASGRAIYETYGKYARDIKSVDVWESIADKIARGLYAIIPMLHPDTIIIGGSIGTYFDRYHKALEAILRENLPEYLDRPRLVQASHPEEAVIYGCRLYALQKTHK